MELHRISSWSFSITSYLPKGDKSPSEAEYQETNQVRHSCHHQNPCMRGLTSSKCHKTWLRTSSRPWTAKRPQTAAPLKKDWRFLMYTKHLVLPFISTPAPVRTPPRQPMTFLLRLHFAITNIEKCNVYVTKLTKLLKPTHLVETQFEETEVFILPRSTGPTKVWDC